MFSRIAIFASSQITFYLHPLFLGGNYKFVFWISRIILQTVTTTVFVIHMMLVIGLFVARECNTKNGNLYAHIFSIFILHAEQLRWKIVECGRIRKHWMENERVMDFTFSCIFCLYQSHLHKSHIKKVMFTPKRRVHVMFPVIYLAVTSFQFVGSCYPYQNINRFLLFSRACCWAERLIFSVGRLLGCLVGWLVVCLLACL